MPETELPKLLKPGISPGDSAPAGRSQLLQTKISSSASLSNLSQEFAIFSPAMMYMYVPLTHDPLHHFAMENPSAPAPFSIKFDKPAFSGLRVPGTSDDTWNHVLYFVDKEWGGKLFQFLGSVAFADRAKGTFCRLRPSNIRIADTVLLSKLAVLPDNPPTVEVIVFGLELPGHDLFVANTDNPWIKLPYVSIQKRLNTDVEAFKTKLLSDSTDDLYGVNEYKPKES